MWYNYKSQQLIKDLEVLLDFIFFFIVMLVTYFLNDLKYWNLDVSWPTSFQL